MDADQFIAAIRALAARVPALSGPSRRSAIRAALALEEAVRCPAEALERVRRAEARAVAGDEPYRVPGAMPDLDAG